jgi:hypothetical protein
VGHGRTVLLVGGHGIGKTRLADELVREAAAAGVEALVGRCYEGEGSPPFWPWIEVLRTYAERRDTSTLAAELGAGATDIAPVVPEIRMHFPDRQALALSSPEEARFRFLDAVCRALVRAALAHPLVVVLDDLYAADRSSLLLLGFLASRLAQARILVVATVRADALAAGRSLAKTITELMRSGVLERLDLGGFSEGDVAALIERLTGASPPPGLAAALLGRTEGVPLYVVEVIRALRFAGSLGTEPTAARTKRPDCHSAAAGQTSGAIDVPPNVRLAVTCQLDPVSSAARELLALAALLGREFRVEVLARAAALEPTKILELLDDAGAAGIVTEVPHEPGRYRFSHALLAEALIDGLSAARRSTLHQRAAEAGAAVPRKESMLPGVTTRDVDRGEAIEYATEGDISGKSREVPGVTGAAAMHCVMRCEGEYWLVAFNGRTDRFRHSLGLRYLAELLWHPGRLARAIDLAAMGRATASPRGRDPDVTLRADLGDAGMAIDARARAEYKQRLAELTAELEEAERANDLGRIPSVRSEIDALTEQLGAAARCYGIASHAERARVAVSKGLTAAIARLARRNLALGEHLRITIKRGYSCAYAPDPRVPICWRA